MYEFAVTPAVTSIRRRGVEIADVEPESLGFELELASGDRIIKVNGRTVRDYLDFRFQTAGETELVLEVKKSTGEDWELQIERAEDEDFGLNFEQIVPRQCAHTASSVLHGNPPMRAQWHLCSRDTSALFLDGHSTTLISTLRRECAASLSTATPQYVGARDRLGCSADLLGGL